MFNLTGSEIIVILLLALVVLGPEKLPDAIRRFAQTYAELKKMGTGFQTELRQALDEPMREMRDTATLLQEAADPKRVAAEAEAEVTRRAQADAAAAAGFPTVPSIDLPGDTPAEAAAAGEEPPADDEETAPDLSERAEPDTESPAPDAMPAEVAERPRINEIAAANARRSDTTAQVPLPPSSDEHAADDDDGTDEFGPVEFERVARDGDGRASA